MNEQRYGIYFHEVRNFDGAGRFVRWLFVPFLEAAQGVAGDVVAKQPVLRPT